MYIYIYIYIHTYVSVSYDEHVYASVQYQHEHECFIAWLRRCRHEPQRAAGIVCLWSSSYVNLIFPAEH